MKRLIIFCGLNLMASALFAQLTSGVTGVTIKQGTTFAAAGLVLTPSSDLQLNNATIQLSTSPVVAPTGQSISRVYNISPALNFSGTAGIKYNASDLNGNNENLLAIAFNNGNGNNYASVTSFDSTTGTYYVYTPNLTNVTMGSITAVDNNVPLPVKITDFSGVNANCSNEISWKAESTDNQNIYVQRSADGKNWITVSGNVRSANGATSVWEDHSPLNGMNIYRLMVVSMTNEQFFTSAITVMNSCTIKNNLELFPNPANTFIKVSIHGNMSGNGKIVILDYKGSIVKTVDANTPAVEIDITSLPAGSYICQFRDAQSTLTSKFVKR